MDSHSGSRPTCRPDNASALRCSRRDRYPAPALLVLQRLSDSSPAALSGSGPCQTWPVALPSASGSLVAQSLGSVQEVVALGVPLLICVPEQLSVETITHASGMIV